MLKPRLAILVSVCLLSAATCLWATTRKAGLWELTTTMTWQQSPLPSGIIPPGGEPHTTLVCLTQQQLAQYGSVLPQVAGCQISNVAVKANSVTADMVCSGKMTGKGTLESSWSNDSHATGTVHFLGSIQLGTDSKTIEWTNHSSSVFKSADCGAVKPTPPAQ
jgi:hypothetical protein